MPSELSARALSASGGIRQSEPEFPFLDRHHASPNQETDFQSAQLSFSSTYHNHLLHLLPRRRESLSTSCALALDVAQPLLSTSSALALDVVRVARPCSPSSISPVLALNVVRVACPRSRRPRHLARALKIGRVVLLKAGPSAGKIAVIVEIINQNPRTSHHRCSPPALPLPSPCPHSPPRLLPSPRSRTGIVRKHVLKAGIVKKWNASRGQRTSLHARKRNKLNDLERFGVMPRNIQRRGIMYGRRSRRSARSRHNDCVFPSFLLRTSSSPHFTMHLRTQFCL